MIRTTAPLALVFLSLLAVPSASAAPGDLDTTFAGRGWALTRQFFPNYNQEYQPKGAEDMARQADGKIVLTGEFLDGQSNWYFGAYRLTGNGDLDRSFGEGGWVDTKVGGIDLPHAVAIQRDGKILLSGESTCAGPSACTVLIRYLPSGALDPSFGRKGIVTVNARHISRGYDVAVLPNGKILLLGPKFTSDRWHDYSLFAVARFAPNGSLDPSFGRKGFAQIGLRAGQATSSFAVQRDGKILIAGTGGGELPNTAYFEIARLRRNGKPDRSFSRDGISIVDWRGRDDGAAAIGVQRDGRIVVVGTSGRFVKYWTDRIAVVRLNRNGTLDRRFGKRLTQPGRYGASAGDVLIQPDGRIVVAGSNSDDRSDNTSAWAIVRYLRNGRLDLSFGHGGIVIGDFGTGHDWASSLELQPDGKLLVGGSIYEDEAVARYRTR